MRRPSLAALLFLASACKGSDAAPAASDPADAAATDTGGTGGEGGSCLALFGTPNDQTGLTRDQCGPACTCGDPFVPPTYDAAFIQSLVSDWQLATPYPAITADPYASPTPPDDPEGTVCAVLPKGTEKPRPYELVTYASEDAARAAGASVTHFGHCGVCSPLANLAVYMRENDLTAPVRSCGLAGGGQDADVACLEKLGFDSACATIWAYNTAHTRDACLSICLTTLRDPYNLPDGGMNPCLQCDEDKSGPVFKAVAGRTRRNSGLPNAICRPCSEVRPLVHQY